MEKTVCELFAGVGGFRLGLEKSSKEWKTVFFSQWEPGKKNQWAYDCYIKHFYSEDERLHINPDTGIDISLVDKNTIANHNLLVGGFPCQDYSVAHSLNTEKGIEGKKGVLWWQIRDTLIAKQTPFVLLENVDRLLKSPSKQRGRDFGIILACLADLDYSVEWRVLNAAEYGNAQRRRRTYIFAYKNTTKFAEKQKKHTPYKILNEVGFFSQTFPILQIEENKINYDAFTSYDLQSISDTYKFNFENTGYMTNGQIYTTKTNAITEPYIPLRAITESNASEEFYITEDKIPKWQYMKGAKRIERVSKTGFAYTFSEGPVAFPDSLDLPARTMLTSEATLNRSTHVIADSKNGRLRLITPLEAERIQGFDDNWTNTGMPQKFRYFCMGNALVVPLVTRMGYTLNQIFERE